VIGEKPMEEKRLFLEITDIDLRKDDLLYFVDVIKNRQHGMIRSSKRNKLVEEELAIHTRMLIVLRKLIASLEKPSTGHVILDQ